MNKYIDTDRLKVVIKQAIRREELNFAALGSGGQTFCINTLEWVLTKIDSLQQEQPEVDLDENTMKEEFRMIDSACLLFNYDKLRREQLIARRFYQLGLSARKEEKK